MRNIYQVEVKGADTGKNTSRKTTKITQPRKPNNKTTENKIKQLKTNKNENQRTIKNNNMEPRTTANRNTTHTRRRYIYSAARYIKKRLRKLPKRRGIRMGNKHKQKNDKKEQYTRPPPR